MRGPSSRRARAVLEGGSARKAMLAEYDALRSKLGPSGASERIASEMVLQLRDFKTGRNE